jgi:ergothioneine biosynthesis protein EgtB
MPDASPTKWHLAHTTWFFETFVLEAHERGFQAFAPAFRVLFNSYYNGVGAKHPRPQRGLLTRPSLDEVLAYRANVDARMARLWPTVAHDDALRGLIELGLQHEQQHQELMLTDILHLLSCNPLFPAYAKASDAVAPEPAGALAWHSLDGGLTDIGHAGSGFAFDNEGPRHRVYLHPYALASRLVTQAEYLAFVEAGGYRNPLLWLAEGWDWRAAQGLEQPLYWHRIDGAWHHCTLGWPAARAAPAGGAPVVLRGRCLCALGRCTPAHRGRMGACGRAGCRWHGAVAWRCVAVDAVELRALPGLSGGGRRRG